MKDSSTGEPLFYTKNDLPIILTREVISTISHLKSFDTSSLSACPTSVERKKSLQDRDPRVYPQTFL